MEVAVGLICMLGWAAVAEAQFFNFLRIQDRTPEQMSNTNYSYSPACCVTGGVLTVLYTVTAVQVRAARSWGVKIHQRLSSTTGPWSVREWTRSSNPGDGGIERDYQFP